MKIWLPVLLASLLAIPVIAYADSTSQIVNGGPQPVSVSVVNMGFGGSGMFNVTFTQPDNPGKLVRGENYTLIVSQSGNVVYNSSKVFGQPTVFSPSGTRMFEMALIPTAGYTANLTVYSVGGVAVPKQSFGFTYENGKYTSTPEFPVAAVAMVVGLAGAVAFFRLRRP